MGEALPAVGVIASLSFVAVEARRQNTAAVRGATLQAVSQQSLDLVMAGLDNPDLRSAFRTAKESSENTLTEEQKNLLGRFISAKLRADGKRFRQVQLGTVVAQPLDN